MTHASSTAASIGLVLVSVQAASFAQDSKPAQAVFVDGQAQVVEAFKDKEQWIQHDLWVETTFDSDGDGELDRMHVDVTRQAQTETEGLKVPVVYLSSPYYCGTGANGKQYFWDPKHEVGATPPMHETPPQIEHQSKRPLMSRRQISRWVPRGFAVVHSASPGTGLYGEGWSITCY